MSKSIIYIVLTGFLLAGYALTGCTSKVEKPAVYTVEIKEMRFVPEVLTVNKGDTVIWVNKDMVVHDVTDEAEKAVTSSPIVPGRSWKMEINYDSNYFCSIHAVMKGKIKIGIR